jgi:hypothetical protein
MNSWLSCLVVVSEQFTVYSLQFTVYSLQFTVTAVFLGQRVNVVSCRASVDSMKIVSCFLAFGTIHNTVLRMGSV